jgi:Domain of unknown function (DUF4389)
VAAFFAILFTGRYPRSLFDFNVGVLRWTWRVSFYAFAANGTDRYPPFTLSASEYPATFDVAYPQHLSRGLVLVKWWLLALPQYLIVAVFAGGGSWLAWNADQHARGFGGGLIALLTFIAVVALLFTGRYPRGIFDLVLGMNRWVLRVAAYAGLMTDAYPPFRLDLGPTEPVEAPPPAAAPAAAPWGTGRIVAVTLGVLALAIGGGSLAAGAATIVLDATQRDAAGYIMTQSRTFSTATPAIATQRVEAIGSGANWALRTTVGTVRIRSRSTVPVFVGIGPAAAVERYLAGVRHAEVGGVVGGHRLHLVGGDRMTVTPPAAQRFWVASAQGAGERALTWQARRGNWRAVVASPDGAAGVSSRLSIGATFPHAQVFGIVMAALGVLLMALGTFGVVHASSGRRAS